MTNEERQKLLKDVVEVLNCATYERPMKVRHLAGYIGIDENDNSCPRTRSLILEVMEKHMGAYGSDTRGYFPLKSMKQVQKYLNGLMKRQVKISDRIRTVWDAYLAKRSSFSVR